MQIVIDISAETYKAISEWEKPNTKYAAEYMLYQFVKNGKRIEQTPCTDAISRKQTLDAFGLSEKTRKYGGDHSGYNTMMLYEIQDVIEGLPSVNPQASKEDIHREREQAYMKGYEDASKRYRTEPCDDAISRSDAIRVASGYCHWSNIPDELAKLPSVNTEKTGRWIRMKAYEKWGCSECYTVFRFTFKEHDYCPNCGAKMKR